jgi:Flp pilus assembly pilin Flp
MLEYLKTRLIASKLVKTFAKDNVGASGLEYAAMVVIAVALIATAAAATGWATGRFGAI